MTHLSVAACFRFKLAVKCWDETTQLWRSRAQGREHSPDPGACLPHGVSWGEAAPLRGALEVGRGPVHPWPGTKPLPLLPDPAVPEK